MIMFFVKDSKVDEVENRPITHKITYKLTVGWMSVHKSKRMVLSES